MDGDSRSLGIHETKADLTLLLECLKCQLDCPSALKQALVTISSICINQAGSKKYLRESGGLQFIFNLATSTGYLTVRETAIYTLGCAIEGNVFSQKLMNTRQTFLFLHGCLLNQSGQQRLQQTAIFCLLCLVANSGQGQMLLRKSGCLEVLLNMFRSNLTDENLVHNEFSDEKAKAKLQLWLTVCNTLCVAVNNPQNDDNQRICAAVFPYALKFIEDASEVKILRSAASFIGLAVANNVHNQDRIEKCGGIASLTSNLYKIINRAKVHEDYLELAVHITKALDACISEHSDNAKSCGKHGAIPLLLKLLTFNTSDVQLKIQTVLTLGHCTDSYDPNQKVLIEHGGIGVLIQHLTASTDDELSKTLKYVLHTCVEHDDVQTDFSTTPLRRAKSPLTQSRLHPYLIQEPLYSMDVLSPQSPELPTAGGDAIIKKLNDLMTKLGEGPAYDEEDQVDTGDKEKQRLLEQLEKERLLRLRYEAEATKLKMTSELKSPPRNVSRFTTPSRQNLSFSSLPSHTRQLVRPSSPLPNDNEPAEQSMNSTTDQLNDTGTKEDIDAINQKLSDLQVTLETLVNLNSKYPDSKTKDIAQKNNQTLQANATPRCTSTPRKFEDPMIRNREKPHPDRRQITTAQKKQETWFETPLTPRKKAQQYSQNKSYEMPLNLSQTNEKQRSPLNLSFSKEAHPLNLSVQKVVRRSPLNLVLPKMTTCMTPTYKRILTAVPNSGPSGTPKRKSSTEDRRLATPQSVKSTRSNISVQSAKKGRRKLELVYSVDSDSDDEAGNSQQPKTPNNPSPDDDGFLRPRTPKKRRISTSRPGDQASTRTPQRQLFQSDTFGKSRTTPRIPSSPMCRSEISVTSPRNVGRNFDEVSEFDCALIDAAKKGRSIGILEWPRKQGASGNVRMTPRKKAAVTSQSSGQRHEVQDQSRSDLMAREKLSHNNEGRLEQVNKRYVVSSSSYQSQKQTPLQQRGVRQQGSSLTGGRASRVRIEQKIVQSCQPTCRLQHIVPRRRPAKEDSSQSDDSDYTLPDTPTSSEGGIDQNKNDQQCPGCHPPAQLEGPTLNSRTFNIALETSYFTCQFHRQLRALERDYTSQNTRREKSQGASRRKVPIISPECRLVNPLSIYDMPSSGSADSHDDLIRRRVTPPNSVQSYSAALAKKTGERKRRQRIPYTEEEIRNLKDGVRKLGKFWNQILFTYKFHPIRTAVDLMEKYKRIMRMASLSLYNPSCWTPSD